MSRYLAWIVLLLPVATAAQTTVTSTSSSRADTIERAVLEISREGNLWPGFRPNDVPLAIFTGDSTFLFRHPSPPEDFRRHGDRWAAAGRHHAMTANSSAMIGGVQTATLLADDARANASIRTLASVAIHEAFHVHQRLRHPSWQGNEADLFTYPVDQSELLVARRLEDEHLRRALDAAGAIRACHAGQALVHRRGRYALMAAEHAQYERRSELNEGLATYVELRAAGDSSLAFPAKSFAADAIRARVYLTGAALAVLLDVAAPGWPTRLAEYDSLFLDTMLEDALRDDARQPGCALPPRVKDAIVQAAQRDANGVASSRKSAGEAFARLPGPRLVIEADGGDPLWPQGFDPMNVLRVPTGLLHRRFLKLGNEAGVISFVDDGEVDLEALTEAAGEHPLFNGVVRVTIAGLASPQVQASGEQVEVIAPGLVARFQDARWTHVGDTILIRLGPRPPSRP